MKMGTKLDFDTCDFIDGCSSTFNREKEIATMNSLKANVELDTSHFQSETINDFDANEFPPT